ncbi:MAG: D-alanyl-D-alanine carboxypeptidase family protein [Kiloniellales bacterium]
MIFANAGNRRRGFFRWPAWLVLVLLSLIVVAGPAEARRYASIVVDVASGQVLYERHADTRAYPASLTKMMTLYLMFEALESGRLSLKRELPVSARAAGMPPSKLGLVKGQTITVENVILALVTKSANDAAVVAAEALAGTEIAFAKEMTRKARELGMTQTTFRNASGLPNRAQRSTARDMAKLGTALIRHFPSYYHYFSTPQFTYRGRTYKNHNSLLDDYPGADGIKTGYIRASGFNLVASVVRDGRRIIAVVFGGKTPRSRDVHMADLLDEGFVKVASLPPPSYPAPPPPKPLMVAEHIGTGKAAPAPAALAKLPQPEETAAGKPETPAEVAADSLTEAIARVAAAKAKSDTGAEVAAAIARVAEATKQPETSIAVADPDRTQLAALAPGDNNDEAEAGGSLEPAADPISGWAIQVGAFSAWDSAAAMAMTAARGLPKGLGLARPTVEESLEMDKPLYRSRLTGFNEARARAACHYLTELHQPCHVVPPG